MNPNGWDESFGEWSKRVWAKQDADRVKREQEEWQRYREALARMIADIAGTPATECCPMCSGKGRVRIVPEAL